MDVPAIFNWRDCAFQPADGPIEFRVVGNPDTRIAIKFFWYPTDKNNAESEELRHQSEPYLLDVAKVRANGVNRVGFIFVAAPRDPLSRTLVASLEARQTKGQGMSYRETYRCDLPAGEQVFEMSDGLTVKL